MNPDFDDYTTEDFAPPSCRQLNVEELAALGVDTVFYWADLAEEDRPRVYCILNQEDGLQCFAKRTYFSMMAEAAGANLVSKDVETNFSGFITITMEEAAGWDPQYVFMGWLDDPALITDNEQWASVAAVKDGNVFTLPCSLNSTKGGKGTGHLPPNTCPLATHTSFCRRHLGRQKTW